MNIEDWKKRFWEADGGGFAYKPESESFNAFAYRAGNPEFADSNDVGVGAEYKPAFLAPLSAQANAMYMTEQQRALFDAAISYDLPGGISARYAASAMQGQDEINQRAELAYQNGGFNAGVMLSPQAPPMFNVGYSRRF